MVSAGRLLKEVKILRTSIQRILKDDLGYFPYKIIIKSFFTDAHKTERKRFANWVRWNCCKEQTMRIPFLDEKLFDIGSVYHFQNDCIWTASGVETNENDEVLPGRKFPEKVMVWLGACSKKHHTTGGF